MVVAQHPAGDEVQRRTLIGAGHRLQRVSARLGKVAQRAHAADLAQHDAGGPRGVAHRVAQRAAQAGIVLARLEHPRLLALEQVQCDVEALARKGQRVAAQIELQRLGVQAEKIVLVGGKGQAGLAAAAGQARQLGRLVGLGPGRVAISNRPEVVFAQQGLERRRCGLAGCCQVDRQILHHRARQGVAAGELRVGQFGVRQQPGGAEVVAQPKGVADLMHRRVLEVVAHELPRLRAVGVDLAAIACGQQVQTVGQLLGLDVAMPAQPGIVTTGPAAGQGQPGGLPELQQVSPQRGVVGEPCRSTCRGAEDPRLGTALGACGQALHADAGMQDFAAARVHMRQRQRGKADIAVRQPTHHALADLGQGQIVVVGRVLDDDGVADADRLERGVPGQDAFADRLQVVARNAAVQPIRDRPHRLGHRCGRVLLFQPPALDVALARAARQVVVIAVDHGVEVADPRVGRTRGHRLVRQAHQRVVQAEEHAARVGQVVGNARRRLARRHAAWGGDAQRAGREMGADL